MTPPPAPPRPRQPSRPDLPRAEVDAVVGVARDQARADSPQRKRTLGGLGAARPASGEFAPTVPAPRVDAPTLPAAASLPPPSHDPRDAQIAALIRERDAALLAAKASAPPDRGAWAKLGYRIAAAVAGVVVLVITALGARAVDAIGAKADATKAAQAKTKEQLSTRELEWRNWAARVVAVAECRHIRQSDLNARQFPESQNAGSKPWPIWKDECGELPKLP